MRDMWFYMGRNQCAWITSGMRFDFPGLSLQAPKVVGEFFALSCLVRYFRFSCALRPAGGVYMVGVLERGGVEGRIRNGLMLGEMGVR